MVPEHQSYSAGRLCLLPPMRCQNAESSFPGHKQPQAGTEQSLQGIKALCMGQKYKF